MLDDDTVLTESIAICRYFEALNPEPPLFGTGALEMAMVEMWNRRLELHLFLPVSQVFRNPHPAMAKTEIPQVPAWAEANKPRIEEFLGIFDRALAAIAEAVNYGLFALPDFGEVDRDVAGMDSVIGGSTREIGHARAGDHRLRWRAADVDAGSADVHAFDDCCLPSCVGQGY